MISTIFSSSRMMNIVETALAVLAIVLIGGSIFGWMIFLGGKL